MNYEKAFNEVMRQIGFEKDMLDKMIDDKYASLERAKKIDDPIARTSTIMTINHSISELRAMRFEAESIEIIAKTVEKKIEAEEKE